MWIFTGASLMCSAWMSVFTRDELDLVDARVDHPVDGVQAGTADTDDLDHGEIRARVARAARDAAAPAAPAAARRSAAPAAA